MTNHFLASDALRAPLPPSRAGFFALAILVPLALAALALWFDSQTRVTESARALVRASYARRIAASELLAHLTEAESAQRGYVVTGDKSYLADYEPDRAAVLGDIDRLATTYGHDLSQHNRVVQLRRLADDKFGEMAEIIQLRDAEGPAKAAERIGQGRGRRIMTQARSLVVGIGQEEDATLGAELGYVRHRNDFTVTFVWSLVVLGGVLLLVTLAVLWQARQARYRLQEQAWEAFTRLQAIFESTTDAIVIFDPDGAVEALNASAAKLLGYEDEEPDRAEIARLIGMSDATSDFHSRIGLIGEEIERPNWLDRIVHDRNGREISVDIALGLMPLANGLHVVAAIRDISERKQIERLKDDFVATVSHELRTPLTSVVGSLGLLRGGAVGELPDAARRLVEIAENNSRRLIRLINDILDIEKIGRGRMRFDQEALDLGALANRAIEGGRGLAETRAIRLEAVMPSQTAIVRGDADRLLQVMGNLLSNATRFSPPQGRIRLSVAIEGGSALVAVEDEGPGVPPAFERRIFERFAQADGEGGNTGGTGLGLAISREIVEAHGGRIGFDRSALGGARFFFSLPLAAEMPAPPLSGSRPRVLLCEDNDENAEVLRGLLEAEHCIVDRVITAAEAERAALSGRYDSIILDLQLPDASGLEAVRALRRQAETRQVPIIVVSGNASEGAGDPAAAALEVIDWIDKPVDQARLVRAVQRAIDQVTATRPTLLHVDDDEDMLEVTATALANQGRMLRATSIASARALLEQGRVDIVILDLNLGDGSGLELLPDLITADGTPIPTIIYSAHDVLPDVQAKVDAVLIKSRRSLPNLAGTIRRLLAGRTPERLAS